MTIYFTSDLHFNHSNILKFNPDTRKYSSVKEMNEALIADWNAVAKEGDTIYILGDVAFMQGSDAAKYVSRLVGEKILITGNHDGKLLKDASFRQCFSSIHSYYELKANNQKFCMFHYPIVEWNQCHRGSVHLHGHLHGSLSGLEEYKAFDVGLDATGKILISLEEIVELAATRKIKKHGDSTTDNMV